MEILDSGERTSFTTGAVRDTTTGKGAFHLVPFEPLWRVAKIYEGGAAKYDARNWEKGIPLSRFYDSATRHWLKNWAGWIDEDHAAMAAWNTFGYMQTLKWIEDGVLPPELDDRPQYKLAWPKNIGGT
jgi:hypothetical protein